MFARCGCRTLALIGGGGCLLAVFGLLVVIGLALPRIGEISGALRGAAAQQRIAQRMTEVAQSPQLVGSGEPERAHAAWSAAMFGGELALAEGLFADGDPQRRRDVTRTFAELTRYAVDSNIATLGRYRRHDVIGTFSGGAGRIGFTRVVYERGEGCFRSELWESGGAWVVASWEPEELAECNAYSSDRQG